MLKQDLSEDEAFRVLTQRIYPRATLLRTWKLTGGVSANVTVIEIEQPGADVTKLIVRQHGEIDRARNPKIAQDEFRLLQIVQSHGVAAPKPVLVDESYVLFPTPVLVIEYIEGETELAPSNLGDYLGQSAIELVKIHQIRELRQISFLPNHDSGFGERPDTLDLSMSEDKIRDALEAALPLANSNPPTLLHGDYWPGNLLRKNGDLAAVIDWEDASIGDPLADLGNSRLEFLWAFGEDAMNEFTRRYLAIAAVDTTNLSYWDLCAALRPCSKISTWGLDEAAERRMRERHRWFVEQALGALPLR